MYRLSNVSLIYTMHRIVDATVENYKTDFDYDVALFKELKIRKDIEKEDFYYLWITRQNGTHLALETTLFHRNSYAQIVYEENKEKGNIFIIDIIDPVRLTGNIVAIRGLHGNFNSEDYPVSSCDIVFSSGHKESYSYEYFDGYKQRLIDRHGIIEKLTYRVSPEDQYNLELHLKILRQQRDKLKDCDVDLFFKELKKDYDKHIRASDR